ncbi:MAG: hypothetical protein QOI59_2842 [Gammaproteobacteria bacterium]|jgi:hypothetical protein|nr:hypothetical protein [Gammaproteobacteria bacterium]
MRPDERERESLKDETRTAIEEVRMVLPGIQALFGFQMIAVFNDRFQQMQLTARSVHLAALGCVALAIALVMAPAAFHRIAERGWVSRRLIDLTSNYLTAGMMALLGGLALDVGVVANLILDNALAGVVAGTLMAALCLASWLLLPIGYRARYRPK